MTSRADLEARLLREPFNHDLRLEYAEHLRDDGEPEDALGQLEILLGQNTERAGLHVAAARCQLALDRQRDALEAYSRARECPDFEAQSDLEELAAAAAGPRLVAGAGADVLPFDRDELGPQAEPVTFDDVAGMANLKKTLRMQIVEPFLRPELFRRFKKPIGGGVLLFGPPGCGKTMMARAIAHECAASFLPVGISDVLNRWIGESERNLAVQFEKARSQAPSVLFFDELDALAYSRSKAVSEHTRTVVNEFLSQLDGFSADNRGVLILAATNMPWDVDSAIKRPGRFARQIFVPPPDAEAREQMLRHKLTGVPTEDVDYARLAATAEHFSGADIDGWLDLAKERVLHDILETGDERPLSGEDLHAALETARASTLDWLRTARNLVKYAGADDTYRDVERYLKKVKLL